MDPNQSNTLNQNGDLNGNPYLFTYIPTNSSLQTMPANYSNMDSSLPQQQQHQPQILTQPIQIQAPTQNQMHNFNQNGTIQQQQPIIIQHQPQQPSPPQTIPSIPNTSSSIVPPSSYSISPSSNTSSARSSPHSVDSPFRITVQPVGWQVASNFFFIFIIFSLFSKICERRGKKNRNFEYDELMMNDRYNYI